MGLCWKQIVTEQSSILLCKTESDKWQDAEEHPAQLAEEDRFGWNMSSGLLSSSQDWPHHRSDGTEEAVY